jgi:hypothetical protein
MRCLRYDLWNLWAFGIARFDSICCISSEHLMALGHDSDGLAQGVKR